MNTYKIIAFDIDNTLTEAKTKVDDEMAGLLCDLLRVKKVVIASGASYAQFKKQLIDHISCGDEKKNLLLLPTNSAQMYSYDGEWKKVYETVLSDGEKKKIFDSFELMFGKSGFVKPLKVYGVLVEDRGSQVTFSALGSEAPRELKEKWDPNHVKRGAMIPILKKYLPEFAISMGGTTSIDVTRSGIDKAYGLKKVSEFLKIGLDSLMYVGDALFPGGNDECVIPLGVKTHAVVGPAETKALIRELIS